MNLLPARRVRFYEKQFLRAIDLAEEQRYHLESQRRINVAQHVWGIVAGLHLLLEDGEFSLEPGLAVDGFGRLLVLNDRFSLPAAAFVDRDTDELDVWLEYRLEPPAADEIEGRCNSISESAARWFETPAVRFAPSTDNRFLDPRKPAGLDANDLDFSATETPPDDSLRRWPVFLGRIRQTEGADPPFAADNSRRPYAGLKAESIEAPSGLARLYLGEVPPGEDKDGSNRPRQDCRLALDLPAHSAGTDECTKEPEWHSVMELSESKAAEDKPVSRRLDLAGDATITGKVTLENGRLEFTHIHVPPDAKAPSDKKIDHPWNIYVKRQLSPIATPKTSSKSTVATEGGGAAAEAAATVAGPGAPAPGAALPPPAAVAPPPVAPPPAADVAPAPAPVAPPPVPEGATGEKPPKEGKTNPPGQDGAETLTSTRVTEATSSDITEMRIAFGEPGKFVIGGWDPDKKLFVPALTVESDRVTVHGDLILNNRIIHGKEAASVLSVQARQALAQAISQGLQQQGSTLKEPVVGFVDLLRSTNGPQLIADILKADTAKLKEIVGQMPDAVADTLIAATDGIANFVTRVKSNDSNLDKLVKECAATPKFIEKLVDAIKADPANRARLASACAGEPEVVGVIAEKINTEGVINKLAEKCVASASYPAIVEAILDQIDSPGEITTFVDKLIDASNFDKVYKEILDQIGAGAKFKNLVKGLISSASFGDVVTEIVSQIKLLAPQLDSFASACASHDYIVDAIIARITSAADITNLVDGCLLFPDIRQKFVASSVLHDKAPGEWVEEVTKQFVASPSSNPIKLLKKAIEDDAPNSVNAFTALVDLADGLSRLLDLSFAKTGADLNGRLTNLVRVVARTIHQKRPILAALKETGDGEPLKEGVRQAVAEIGGDPTPIRDFLKGGDVMEFGGKLTNVCNSI